MLNKSYITPRDVARVGGVCGLLMILTLIAVQWFGDIALAVALWLGVLLVLLGLVVTNKRAQADFQKTNQQRRQDYNQLEALFSLFFTLQPHAPLPDMRGWAESPDYMKRITQAILQDKPELVVELGSGVSTLVIAYALQRAGRGRVVSLEHDQAYAAPNQEMLHLHGLENVATIIHAPLRELALGNETWQWYDASPLPHEEPIDLLLVDGPPAAPKTLSRYPALPLLFDRLRDGARIFLDDGSRQDEQLTVQRWRQEFPALDCEFLEVEKGAFELRKRA